MASEKLIF